MKIYDVLNFYHKLNEAKEQDITKLSNSENPGRSMDNIAVGASQNVKPGAASEFATLYPNLYKEIQELKNSGYETAEKSLSIKSMYELNRIVKRLDNSEDITAINDEIDLPGINGVSVLRNGNSYRIKLKTREGEFKKAIKDTNSEETTTGENATETPTNDEDVANLPV